MMQLNEHDALIAVDVQNDFCPGGALAVPTGHDVARTMTQVAERFRKRGTRVYATMDWHPAGHSSFRDQGGPWPPHCVQGSRGAEFHPDFKPPEDAVIVKKGTHPDKDAYSGFIDSDLEQQLRDAGVQRVFVGGLATDYCVLHTVLDAAAKGFETYVLTDSIGGVNVQPGDDERAVEQMQQAGAAVTAAQDVLA